MIFRIFKKNKTAKDIFLLSKQNISNNKTKLGNKRIIIQFILLIYFEYFCFLLNKHLDKLIKSPTIKIKFKAY